MYWTRVLPFTELPWGSRLLLDPRIFFTHLSVFIWKVLCHHKGRKLAYTICRQKEEKFSFDVPLFLLKKALTTQVVMWMVMWIISKSFSPSGFLSCPGNTAVTRHEGPYDKTVSSDTPSAGLVQRGNEEEELFISTHALPRIYNYQQRLQCNPKT